MKKAIVIRAFSPRCDFLGDASFLSSLDDFARCFDKAVAAGFEGVQLFLEPEGYFSLQSDRTVAEGIAEAACRAGVALACLEIKPFSYSFTSDDIAVRAEALTTVRRAMEIASDMGIAGVHVIPGYVGLPWDRTAPTVRYDLAYERTRECLRQLVPSAEKLGVSMFLENIWNKFLLSPLEMRGLLDEVGSPHVGMLLDTGNVIAFGYPEHWIAILGQRIREVHAKDFRESAGGVTGFVNLLEGDVNWPAVMTALEDIHFDGFFTAEVFPYCHHSDAILRHTSESMDRILRRSGLL